MEAKNTANGIMAPAKMELTDAQFKLLSDFIQNNVGIKMPVAKKLMVQSRLYPRIKALNFDNFDDYIKYTFNQNVEGNEEIALMIDAITTNLTHFFRESQHFDYVMNAVLPEMFKRDFHTIELWSAGCSSGEEPYTLSIVMQEYMKKHPGQFRDYKILATDISSRVLAKAINAVYPMESVEQLSYDCKKQYFLKSRDPQANLVRVNKTTREKVKFERLNFMSDRYPVSSPKNIIFCRNVLIYFDKKMQEEVIRKLTDHLIPGGYLFLGHSETIFGMDLPLQTVAPTVFKKI